MPSRPWGHARLRRVRDLHAPELQLRPRRARCPGCAATHVLLPGTVLPRRADTTATIGTALASAAAGHGHRRIAAEVGRPISTVRRWLRAIRGTHPERLRASALNLLARLDRDAICGLAPRPNRLAEALDAVAAAALAVRASRPARPDLGGGGRSHRLAAAALPRRLINKAEPGPRTPRISRHRADHADTATTNPASR